MVSDPLHEWLLKLWKEWDVRIFVLFSLLLQAILIFLAPLRKRNPHKHLSVFIWCAYIVSDWVAAFALGLISNNQKDNCSIWNPEKKTKNQDLLSFWAPFLLLHLGGPDTITAFALEDNELWVRHLLGLFLQLSGASYIFFRSLPQNKLWIPTCLMFVVGIIKYGERNQALYRASLGSLRDSMLMKPDPGLNYPRLMDKFRWIQESGVPVRIEEAEEPKLATSSKEKESENYCLDNIVLVKTAYDFFNTSKGLIVDYIFSFYEREESRRFFLKIEKADEAFRLVEIELGFIYDLFYTKASVLHDRLAYVLRVICFTSTLIALFLFLFTKDQVHRIDVAVTYALLLGAISLEVVALLMLIFSDWTILLLKNSSKSTKSVFYKILINGFFFKKPRWSESISQFHLVSFYLSKRNIWMDKIANYLGCKNFLDEMQYKYHKPLSYELKKFIFQELKDKSSEAESLNTVKQICSSRGDYCLRDHPRLSWSFKVDFDESILLWHIATNLLYHKEDDNTKLSRYEEEMPSEEEERSDVILTQDDREHREFCKILSDYMLYLLVMKPTIITSAVTSTARRRYQDTRAVAEKFFSQSKITPSPLKKVYKKIYDVDKLSQLKKAYKKLYDVDKLMIPAEGNRSNSVFFEAVRLAKDLQKVEVGMWKIMDQMWVELLCYAASHCKAITHVQQVSRGGELVTLVWLLMFRFGLGDQFAAEKGKHRSMLVVEK